MSIPDLIHKIKSKIDIDKSTILFLFIIVGVGIGSFGLGKFSIDNRANTKNDISVYKTGDLLENKNTNSFETSKTSFVQSGEKRYVASKNGKMYYSPDCSGSKRIKQENEVWFESKIDAEKSGYILSSTCK